ncbi:hypothetical protein AVEN_99187-1 [Araneus ventricosus]|uniref:Uncharacterized protein n=1 Tax=Araneus ventricosus TaxID=182803 RepID=A0A4Y2CJS7_ARAVE|nr:hypothetical protein AVEN_99187-1 [Araneus ventricosus]
MYTILEIGKIEVVTSSLINGDSRPKVVPSILHLEKVSCPNGLMARSQLRDWKVPSSKPNSTKDPPRMSRVSITSPKYGRPRS